MKWNSHLQLAFLCFQSPSIYFLQPRPTDYDISRLRHWHKDLEPTRPTKQQGPWKIHSKKGLVWLLEHKWCQSEWKIRQAAKIEEDWETVWCYGYRLCSWSWYHIWTHHWQHQENAGHPHALQVGNISQTIAWKWTFVHKHTMTRSYNMTERNC